jgi:hypothetical protein
MKTVEATVEVSVGTRKFSAPMEKIVFESREDVLDSISTDKGLQDILGHINYSIDLEERGKVRQQILNGPAAAAQAEEKSIKELMKVRAEAGKPVTADQARKIIEFMKTMDLSNM